MALTGQVAPDCELCPAQWQPLTQWPLTSNVARSALSTLPALPSRSPWLLHTSAVPNPVPPLCREDLSRELSFTEARRALVGDVNLLRRIWKFLNSWQVREGWGSGGGL